MLQKVTSPLGPKPAVLRTASFPSLFHALLLTGLSKTQPVPVYCLQGQNLQLLAPEKGWFGQHWSGPERRGEEQRSKRGPSAWPGSQLRHLVGAPHPSVKWARQGPALRALGRAPSLDACLCPSSPLRPCPSPPRPSLCRPGAALAEAQPLVPAFCPGSPGEKGRRKVELRGPGASVRPLRATHLTSTVVSQHWCERLVLVPQRRPRVPRRHHSVWLLVGFKHPLDGWMVDGKVDGMDDDGG